MTPADEWHLSTEGGIPYRILQRSPSGEFDEVNGEIQERLLIRASDMQRFIEESFSKYEISGTTWNWTPGRSYPGHQFVTKNVKFEPFDPSLPGNPFSSDPSPPADSYGDFMVAVVTYTSSQNKEWEADAVEFGAHVSGEFMLTKMAFPCYWGRYLGYGVYGAWDKIKDVTSIPRVIPGIEWTVKFRPIPWVALPRVVNRARGLLGCVNNDTTLPLFSAVNKETIMFVGMGMRSVFTWRSSTPYAWVEMKFLERRIIDDTVDYSLVSFKDTEIGWNHVWNPERGCFMRVLRHKLQWTLLGNLEEVPFQYQGIYKVDSLASLFNLRS